MLLNLLTCSRTFLNLALSKVRQSQSQFLNSDIQLGINSSVMNSSTNLDGLEF